MNNSNLLHSVIKIAKQAGEAILAVYHNQEAMAVQIKADQSPLTQADIAAHTVIIEALSKLTPEWPVLSEEGAEIPYAERAKWQRYWLIDPLDGTREFIERNGEFTVNIALIENHEPSLGVVYAPILNTCYFAQKNHGAYKQIGESVPQPIQTKRLQNRELTIIGSRHHGRAEIENFLKPFPPHQIIYSGSAIKFCLVAEGRADLYPRLTPTSEWDTAAAQCVLFAAGGNVFIKEGGALLYNTKASLQNPSFLAVGDLNFNWLQYWQ